MGLNESHDPSPSGEDVLLAFKQEREQHGESRMTPELIRERLSDMGRSRSKQSLNQALQQLVASGWLRKLAKGLYEFDEDPRES